MVWAVFWHCMSIRSVLSGMWVQYGRRRNPLKILGMEVRLGHVGSFRTLVARGVAMSERVPRVCLVDEDKVTRSYFNAALATANVT
jgi:hypothetical protein